MRCIGMTATVTVLAWLGAAPAAGSQPADEVADPPVQASPAPAPSSPPSPPDAAEPAPAVDPDALPVRRAVDELGRVDSRVPLPSLDPCPPKASSDGGAEDDVPCFPVSVEVQGLTPQQKLERFFGGFDPLGGPPPQGSAPTHKEVLTYSGLPPITSVDFVAALRALLPKRADTEPPVYFLYLVREGERAWAELRQGRVPPALAHARPGRSYEEIAGYPERKSAQAAYERLEDALSVRASSGNPLRFRP